MKNAEGKKPLGRMGFDLVDSIGRMMSEGEKENIYLSKKIVLTLHTPHHILDTLLSGLPSSVEGYRILFVRRGGGTIRMNFRDYTVEQGSLLYMTDGCIVESIHISSDLDVCGTVLSEELVSLASRFEERPLVVRKRYGHCIPLCEGAEGWFSSLIGTSIWLLRQGRTSSRTLTDIASLLLDTLEDILKEKEEDKVSSEGRSSEIFRRFTDLVAAECRSHRDVGYYASRLCITPRYLGHIVYSESGEYAKDWIDKAVVSQAKVMLKYSSLPVGVISEELGFPAPSFFCKYFRSHAGMTPLQYRKS